MKLKRPLFTALLALVVVLAIALVLWLMRDHEQADFESAMASHNPKTMQEFIRNYPESPHKEDVSLTMTRMENRVGAYLLFLHHYPKSKHAQEIYGKIDSLGMVFVEGGRFLMGCDTCQSKDEAPVHEVLIRDFFVDKTEVTVAQFRKFIQATGYKTDAEREGSSSVLVDGKWENRKGINWRHDVAGQERNPADSLQPVSHVSWLDARKFAEWAGKRLPTEAEWEYAARGGKLSRNFIFSGSNAIDEVAWYNDNSGNTSHRVAQKKPNELGLYDMSGNVYEWCSDWFEAEYYSNSPHDNPTGPQTGDLAVLRGGGWNSEADELHITNRINAYPLHWYGAIGFRCVVDMPQELKVGNVPR